MKRFLCVVLALLICVSPMASAYGDAKNGVKKKMKIPDELVGSVICNYKLFTITITDAEIRKWAYSDSIDLLLYVDIVNNNNFSYEGYIVTVTVNGWQTDRTAWFRLGANKKQKEKFTVSLDYLDIDSLEEIETFTISFKLLYSKYAVSTDEIALHLK